MKRLVCLALCLIICALSFSGCNFMLGETDSLLRSPEPQGELGEISDALKSAVGKKFTLKTPKSGEWRTAFVMKDIDGDETDEALAFYATVTDDGSDLHLSVINDEKGDWKVQSDFILGGTDIERIEFGDLDGDGACEVAVAWSIYGAPETRLTVLSPSKKENFTMYEGSYTDFCIFDAAPSAGDELFLLTTDIHDKITRCSMFYGEEKLQETGSVALSGNVSSVKKFHTTEIAGASALLIDAMTPEGGYFTEIVTINGNTLTTPLSVGGGKANVITGRYQPLNCGDVNGDKTPEIPCMTVLPNGGNSDGTLYLTEWKSYKEGKLVTAEKSVVSKLMQYKIKVDPDWQGRFTCVYSGENDGLDLYTYGAKKGLGKKILSLWAVPKNNLKKSEDKDAFIIEENDKTVYLGKIHIKDNALSITENSVKAAFSQKITEGTEE